MSKRFAFSERYVVYDTCETLRFTALLSYIYPMQQCLWSSRCIAAAFPYLLRLVDQGWVRDGFAHFELVLLVFILLRLRHGALSNKKIKRPKDQAKQMGTIV